MSEKAPASVMDSFVALAKRRGFVYQASEIYGGIRGFWDYGPLGVLLKNNIRDHWWKSMVECPPIGPDGEPINMVGLDSAIIQHPKVWKASGHVDNFNDPMSDCRETKLRYRSDHIWTATAQVKRKNGNLDTLGVFSVLSGDEAPDLFVKKIDKLARKTGGGEVIAPTEFVPFTKLSPEQQAQVVGPDATQPGTLTEPRPFNMMMISYNGPIQDEENKVYLRPETAQGIFTNYKNVVDTTRVRMPFGIAQIGKSYRNEVTPRNFIFRSREFEQMEMEFFCADQALQWFEFWRAERMKWWLSLGIKPENLIFRDHEKTELSHYSKGTTDIEYRYPFTAPEFGELEGIAHRGDFDLTQHQTHSGAKLDYFDQELQLKLKAEGRPDDEVKKRSRYLPNVIEPASGLTRAVLVLLCECYTVENRMGVERFEYFRFKPQFAPIKAGIFPLVNKDGMPEVAQKLYMDLRTKFTCEYDAKQAIGRRYARMDEIGTPFCITIDGQTLTDQTVTIRERDTQAQVRVNLSQVETYVRERLV